MPNHEESIHIITEGTVRHAANLYSEQRICRWGTSSSAVASVVCRRRGNSVCTPSCPPPHRPSTPPEKHSRRQEK
jgi:hypothetical protein